MLWTADLETTTDIDDCRVWSWGLCEVGKPEVFFHDKDLTSFMEHVFDLAELGLQEIYFHNEKFDGTFIMVWLFEHGFTHIINRNELQDRQFSTLISSTGLFYSITIMLHKSKDSRKTQKIVLLDSLKILPFSVKEIAKGFGLPIKKGEIDYNKYRPIGYEPTAEEIDYQKNDVAIVSMALAEMRKLNLKEMTQGSNALHSYKQMVSKKIFDRRFPELPYEVDKDIRKAYKGGFTYLDKRYTEIDIQMGIVLDVNSLYPSRMRNCLLPYGMPVYFNGEYVKDELYPLYVQRLKCHFQLKPNHIPTIQIKKSIFNETEYLENNAGEDVTLTLTNVDLELFFKHYEVYNIEYISGWKFKGHVGFFTEYIDKWTAKKIEAKKTGNKALYTLSKLMLNALYGKFGLNPDVQSKIPYYDNGMVKYRQGLKERRKPVYLPVAAFTTAYARYMTITSAQSVYDRFMYADTDSLHLKGTELPEGLEIDDAELGKWKHESTFRKARYLRQKSYIEDVIITEKEYNKLLEDGVTNLYIENGQYYHLAVTCAGMPERCHQLVTWENFRTGFTIDAESEYAKLRHKNVKGGVVLVPEEFSIKEKKYKEKKVS